ncbi:MAG: hypothetical protein DIZ80_06415 [endosymbiont of Galathealinum brachiosum]|uniref:O-antigen ligase-related domain-containing protein n=1 Tax=endosymbiont of Galathealinum brachiosum TaxID=2200906 RepID=A0A370DHG4_9GAMM|nr:MAG: hypothetical protein DIZ80_06415 [endosymbiont of Galathealinum brachiosum]
MTLIYIYYIKLFIAPQWWLEPFIGIRVDLILYPVWLAIISMSKNKKYFYTITTIDKYFIFFVCWLLISIALNTKNELSMQHATQYILWLLMYKLFQATVTDFESLKKAVTAMCAVVFLLVIEGIQHKLSFDGLGWAGQGLGWVQKEVLAQGGTGRTRWVSIFDGPGVFCIAYTTALPFVMRYMFIPTSKYIKILSTALSIAFLIAIYFTGSRGGFLATVSILTLFIMYKSNISISKLLIISAVLVVLFSLAPSHLTNVKDSSNSAQHRVDMWGKGADMFRYHPVLGVGRGNYKSYSYLLIAHNSMIEIMAETGFPGVFFWVALIYLAFKGLYLAHKNEDKRDNKMFITSIAISLAGYLVSSIFVTAEFETMYMLIAFAAIASANEHKTLVFSAMEKIYLAGFIIFLYLFIRLFVGMYFG